MKFVRRHPLFLTLAASFVLHGLVMLAVIAYLQSETPTFIPTPAERTLELVMLPEPEDKPPPPEHNEDDPNKANNQTGVAEQKQAKKPKIASAETATTPVSIDETHQIESAFKIPKQNDLNDLDDLGLEQLDNEALDDALVENPLSENEEALNRWYNEVYKRLSAQVAEVWVKPDGSSKHYRGVIRLKIDLQGYLNSAWIHLPSGDKALDQSALMAVKSIIRYQLPESPNMARYYQNLEFRYSGE